MIYEGKRWLRVASLYPETINYVEYFKNGERIYTAYDEPFSLFYQSNWRQDGCPALKNDKFKAIVHLRTGNMIELGSI